MREYYGSPLLDVTWLVQTLMPICVTSILNYNCKRTNWLIAYSFKLTCLASGTYHQQIYIYEGWNFNSGNYLFTTDTK